jgi:hypothetical protein
VSPLQCCTALHNTLAQYSSLKHLYGGAQVRQAGQILKRHSARRRVIWRRQQAVCLKLCTYFCLHLRMGHNEEPVAAPQHSHTRAAILHQLHGC